MLLMVTKLFSVNRLLNFKTAQQVIAEGTVMTHLKTFVLAE